MLVPTSSANMPRTATRMLRCTWATWIRRYVLYFASMFSLSCSLLLAMGVAACMQVTEEMVWELFTQAGPVGE